MISLFIAGLFVVAAVDSLPQLIQPFDQTLVGSPDSTIAYNPDSPQNAIGTFDSPTNPPNFFGSTAGLEDLTKSTETAQMSSVLSKNPATWFSYNLPNSDVSAAPNTPSNSDVSSGSVVSYNANDSPKSLDTLTSNDQTPISSIKGVPDTPGEDELVAQEGVIPEGVLPKFGSPGGITPSGSDVTTPVPDSAISNPDWSYTDVERYPRIDGEENHEPDCTQLNGYNPRIAMCCTRGPPFIRGSYKTSPTGQSILDPTKLTRRGNCDLWNLAVKNCWSEFNRFCCLCRDIRKTAYDCYSPYFRFLEFATQPTAPDKAQPGPAIRHFSLLEVAAELGNGLFGIAIRPGREFWEGPEGGPQGQHKGGQHLGSDMHDGSCSKKYLEWIGVTVKTNVPKGKIPF